VGSSRSKRGFDLTGVVQTEGLRRGSILSQPDSKLSTNCRGERGEGGEKEEEKGIDEEKGRRGGEVQGGGI